MADQDGTWIDEKGWVHRKDGTIDPIASMSTPETRHQLAEVAAVQEQIKKDVAELNDRLDPRLHPVSNAIHELRKVLPATALIPGNPLPAALIDKLAEALEEAARALGG